jgi:hypothetical protein
MFNLHMYIYTDIHKAVTTEEYVLIRSSIDT